MFSYQWPYIAEVVFPGSIPKDLGLTGLTVALWLRVGGQSPTFKAFTHCVEFASKLVSFTVKHQSYHVLA